MESNLFQKLLQYSFEHNLEQTLSEYEWSFGEYGLSHERVTRIWTLVNNQSDLFDVMFFNNPFIPLTHVEHSATYGAWKRNHLLHRLNFRSASSLRASRPMMHVSITSWPFALAERALPAHHAARKVVTIS